MVFKFKLDTVTHEIVFLMRRQWIQVLLGSTWELQEGRKGIRK